MAQPISSADFDSNLNLVNPDFQGPVVILFWSSGCPHCTHYHPTFQQAAQEAAKYGVRFLEVHTPDNPDLMTAVENHPSPKFKVDGIPTIVSYNNGQYWSTYGPGRNRDKFRSFPETVLFAKTIQQVPVSYV
jgi:thiol-disulfide isomerase/thioredoxin